MIHHIDRTDFAILRILQVDSSTSHKQIAGRLNKSNTTICNRIKWLVKNGYISNYRAMLDRRKLNLDILGCLYLRLENSTIDTLASIKQFLVDKNGVSGCWGITGTFNIKLEIVTKDMEAFSEVVSSIITLKNVKEHHSYIHTDELIADRGFFI